MNRRSTERYWCHIDVQQVDLYQQPNSLRWGEKPCNEFDPNPINQITYRTVMATKRLNLVTDSVLKAFFAAALLKSNNLTVQSRDPDARIASRGWNSRQVTSSTWSYKVLITGWPC